jgi:hypothetical protein
MCSPIAAEDISNIYVIYGAAASDHMTSLLLCAYDTTAHENITTLVPHTYSPISDGYTTFSLSDSYRLTAGERTTILLPLTYDTIADAPATTTSLSTYSAATDDELESPPPMRRKQVP